MSERDRILKRLRRHEDQAVKRLLRLLRLSRESLRQRIAALPFSSSTAGVLRDLERSVEEAMQALTGQLTLALGEEAREAMTLGVLLAEHALPAQVVSIRFSLSAPLLDQLSRFQANLVQGITSRLREQVTRQIQLGVLSGKSLPQVAQEIGLSGIKPIGPFKTAETRAEAIARTEVNRVANLATDQRLLAAKDQVPGLQKEWLATHDPRTRDSHRAADGQRVPVDGYFEVGGHQAKHPLDPALPASETVHCRCRSVPVVPTPDR